VDQVGNLLVCDTRRNMIRILDSDGQLLSSVGAIEDIPLHNPLDLSIMRGGEAAVLDFDGRIRIF
jgi:hypothetical protein